MLRIAPVLAAILLAAPQLAQAAEPACLTPREFTALSTYALPSVIGGTARACSTTLPATAYLRRSGGELAGRYAAGKARAWPEARAAFLKLSADRDPGTAQLLGSLPDGALQQMADAALAGIVTDEVKPASCQSLDRMASLLAPLPAENTAELIAVLVGLGATGPQPRLGKLSLCKA